MMTNEELAAAILEVRRLNEAVANCDPAATDLSILHDAKEAASTLYGCCYKAVASAADAQSEFHIGEFVDQGGTLNTVVANIYDKGKIESVLEQTEKSMETTHGYTFRAKNPVKANPADYEWDSGARKWRLKPSGTAPV